jgi:hypothetical protein
MGTFPNEGEFLQVSVENDGRVSRVVSRYEDEDKEKRTFIDQFFKSAKLAGNRLTFTAKTVQGRESNAAKATIPETTPMAFCRGRLTQNSTDADKKATSGNHEVEFEMFPPGCIDRSAVMGWFFRRNRGEGFR